MTKPCPYEYTADGLLAVKMAYLVTGKHAHPSSLRLMKYHTLLYRCNSNNCCERQLQSGCRGKEALVEFRSLDLEWQEELIMRFGKPQKQVQQSYFAGHYEFDAEAFRYYSEYRYGTNDENRLTPETIDLYTYQASVLNTALKVNTNRKAYAKALGGVKLDIWESLRRDIESFTEVDHQLPTTNTDYLRRKLTEYTRAKDRYAYLVSGKYGKRNAAKIKDKEQLLLLEELMSRHQNLNNEQVADIYNLLADPLNYKRITGAAVAEYRGKMDLATHAGRRGETSFMHKKEMQVKRKRPSLPMLYWTLDGWDAENAYQKTTTNADDHNVTSYHHRKSVVVVLDPYNNYPIGYAIGDNESPALIRQAVRDAVNHTRQLFGKRYLPLQLQSDRYQIKNLKDFYNAMCGVHTPAKVKNSKSKVIEPYFNELNRDYFQAGLLPNWTGHNLNARRENQPNADYLNKIRHLIPDEAGAIAQIQAVVAAERAKKQHAYLQHFEGLPEADRIELSTANYLRWFGETTGYTNRLQGEGLTPTLLGEGRAYDSFDLNFRMHAHVDWLVRYDPEDLSEVLVTNAESKDGRLIREIGNLEYILQAKYVQPMALYDRKDADSDELERIKNFNKDLRQHVLQRAEERHEVLTELMSRNKELETLQKLMITDSRGQHKDQKSSARLRPHRQTATQEDEYELIDNVRDQY